MLYTFLHSLYMDWIDPKDGLGDRLSQMQLDRIGTHLMPLYYQLARFALDIAALDETTYVNKQGSHLPYPQFAELRAVLQQIRAETKDLKLEAMWEQKFSAAKSLPGGTVNLDSIMQSGRPGAYEDMVKRARLKEKKK